MRKKKIYLLALFMAPVHCTNARDDLASLEVKSDAMLIAVPRQLTAGNESNFSPDLSSDGKNVVFTSDKRVNKDIWIKRTSGGFAHPLTSHSADDFAAVLNHDSSRIAFVSRRLDAAGNIHVLELDGGFTGLFGGGSNEGKIQVIDLPSTEEMSPSWFPDGKRLVFAARKFSGATPDLMVASVSDLKAVPLGGAQGDQPTVSSNGKMIAYVKNGAIHVHFLDTAKTLQITAGGLVQDGQPRFFNDDQSLVFTRYGDDSNRDGKLDADDHSTIWQLDLGVLDGAASKLDSAIAIPLTSASFSAFSPQIRDDVLLFTRQSEAGLNIFYLPKNGQVEDFSNVESALKLFEDTSDYHEKTLVLRKASTALLKSKQLLQAGEAHLQLLFWYVKNNRRIEAQLLNEEIEKLFSGEPELLTLAKMTMVELDLAPMAFPAVNRIPSPEDIEAMNTLIARLAAIVPRSGDTGSAVSHRVLAFQQLVKAKILASMRSFFEADQILNNAVRAFSGQENICAQMQIYSGLVGRELINRDTAIQRLTAAIVKYPKFRTLLLEASNYIVDIVAESKAPMEELAALRKANQDLPVLPAIAHLRIANIFAKENKPIVAANELRQMVLSYPRSPEIVLQAASHLVEIMESTGRVGELEPLMFQMHEQFKRENPPLAAKSQALLISFLLRKGSALMRQNDVKGAQTAYLTVTAIEADNIAANRGIIDAAFRLGTLEGMKSDLEDGADDLPISPERIYIWGYAKTYEIDQARDDAERISKIDQCIDIIEGARELNGQSVHIHQTLGWLYYQRGFWTQRYQNQNSWMARVERSWQIFTGFFGGTDPDWFELGIDSNAAAYFLAEAETVEKANIAQNLGHTYYLSKNYQKALTYYMARIKMLDRLPVSDPRAEAQLLAQAGRAAFHSDEYPLAASLQSRALEAWERLNDETRVAYSLDALALTYRQVNNFSSAIREYQRLLRIHVRRNDSANAINACINLGYSYFQNQERDQAIYYLRLAESGLQGKDPFSALRTPGEQVEQNLAGGATNAMNGEQGIQIALGGKSSAKGFDQSGKLSLIYTVLVKIYDDIGRVDLAIAELERKISQLEEDRRLGKEDDKGESYLAEDLAIARNNLASFYLRASDHDKARQNFEDALALSRLMRIEGQNWMSDGEWQNLVNIGRTNLRFARMGVLNQETLRSSIQTLEAEIGKLRAARSQQGMENGTALVRLTSVLGLLKTYSDDPLVIGIGKEADLQQNLEESFDIIARENLKAADLNTAMFAWQGAIGEFRLSEKVNASRSKFRKDMVRNPSSSWKIPAVAGDWAAAYAQISKTIARGRKIVGPTDLLEFRQAFEEVFSQGSEDPYLLLRNYQRTYYLNLARNHFKHEAETTMIKAEGSDVETSVKVDPYRSWVKIETIEAIKNSLSEGEAVLLIHRSLKGQIWAFLHDHTGVESATMSIDQPQASVASSYAPVFEKLGLGKRPLRVLYIVPSHELFDLAWSSVPLSNGKTLGQLYGLSFLPQVDLLPKISAKQRNANFFLGLVDGQSEESKLPETAGYNIRPVRWSKFVDFPMRLNNFQVVTSKTPLYLDDSNPVNSLWKIPAADPAVNLPQDLPLHQLARENLNHLTAIIFAKLIRTADPVHKSVGSSDGWAALAYSGLASGMGSFLIPTDSQLTEEELQRFYLNYSTMPLAEAVRAAAISARVIGLSGQRLPADEDELEALNEAQTEDAEELEVTKKYREAGQIYMDLYSIQVRTGQLEEAAETLAKTRTAYFKAGDWESALKFQLIIAELDREKDPESYANKSLEAAAIATRAEKYTLAEELFARAESFFSAEDDDSGLANTWRSRAVSLDMEKKYLESIRAFEKARALYASEDSKKLAAQMILDQGNVYALKLNDFPAALDKYRQASEAFLAIGDNESYYLIQIDRANAFNKIGQTNEAIQLLTKVLASMDKEKSLIPWIRTSQGLANAYYLVGQSGTAAIEIEGTFDAIEDIEDEARQVNQQIEASNLKAMILAKLGKLNEAFNEFKESLATTRKFKLKAKQSLILNNYGYWLREAGQAKESIRQLEEALQIDTDLNLPKDIAFDERNLAISVIVLGDYNRAEDLLKSSLAVSEKLGVVYNSIYNLFGLAEVALRTNRYADAKIYLTRILELAMKNQQSDFPWKAMAGLARIAFLERNLIEAKRLYTESLSFLERRRAGLRTETSITKLMSEISVSEVYDEYIELLASSGETQRAWEFAERAKSRSYFDTFASQQLGLSDPTATAFIVEQNRLFDDILLLDVSKSQASAGQPEHAAASASLETKVEALRVLEEKTLALKPELSDFAPHVELPITKVVSLVPEGAVLVEYKITANYLLIWTIAKGGINHVSVAIERAKLEALVSDMQQLVANYSTTEHVGAELYKYLILPVETYLGSASELIISTDGFLSHVPFAALENVGQYLVERWPVSYVESARAAVSYWQQPRKTISPRSTKILAMGNPTVLAKADLPFAKKEVESIKRYFDDVQVLTGDQVTKGVLAGAKDKFDIVHLASHSEFDSAAPLESKFYLSGEDDIGILTVAELVRFGIQADLVVLSACESSLHGITSGREVVGINRLLAMSGTNSVLSSLWRISDVASAVVMKRFYRYLADGHSKAIALKMSQVDAMKNFKHPAYWASFKLAGR